MVYMKMVSQIGWIVYKKRQEAIGLQEIYSTEGEVNDKRDLVRGYT